MELDDLHPMFIGAYGENANVLEDLLTDFIRDHVYWRRNYHPENQPPIPTSAQYSDAYVEFLTSMKQELFRLSADLKKSCPFFSPRYVGHMASDLLLPGLIARMITTLYNPNNVTEEAAPATVEKEIKVGYQLADMFGYNTDKEADRHNSPRAWGHLTSGGSVANYEALRNFMALKFFPLAVAEALQECGLRMDELESCDRPLQDYTDLELFHLSLETIISLREQILERTKAELADDEFADFRECLRRERIESLGHVEFFRKHDAIEPPKLLVPVTSHYSWSKAMKVLGLGTSNLVEVPVDNNMRLDASALERRLGDCLDHDMPVLGIIGVLGNTEFGTVDPLHRILDIRDRFAEDNWHVPVHIDAAWGGYLASVFRNPDGSFQSRQHVGRDFDYFPSETLYSAFKALSRAESITVDPHKLGYVPYPAGAYVAKDERIIDFIPQKAAYVFDDDNLREKSVRQKLGDLGQYILEGSKPGASAASVYVTHKVLPLHSEGFGRILKGTVRACEYFFDHFQKLTNNLAGKVRLHVPFEPDSNIICFALNPVNNTSVRRMNEFARAVFDHMAVDTSLPIQRHEFIASKTKLFKHDITPEHSQTILDVLGLASETFVASSNAPERAADHLFLIRNTLMNPWLLFEEKGENYIDKYFQYLNEIIDTELEAFAQGTARHRPDQK